MLYYIVLCVPYYGVFVKDSFLEVALGGHVLTGVEVLSPSFSFLPILVPVLHPFYPVCPSLHPCPALVFLDPLHLCLFLVPFSLV